MVLKPAELMLGYEQFFFSGSKKTHTHNKLRLLSFGLQVISIYFFLFILFPLAQSRIYSFKLWPGILCMKMWEP